jgi:uncharacterized heparinase superfamily protein
LRIVNWIKWHLAGNELSRGQMENLLVQADRVRHGVEYHLLGNHLIANAKSLVYSGLFFAGEESDSWLGTGRRLLKAQLNEQILPDGGHFERSPMYHGIILEDVLDLINALRVYGDFPEEKWLRTTATKMFAWFDAVRHPDGGIPFFNDSTHGISPRYEALTDYARRLCVPVHTPRDDERPRLLAPSGFVRMARGPFFLVADVGGIAPDYQPGHAHAETLSFELSVGGHRCFVNTGISCYGVSPERARQRGSTSHNCLLVDEKDSSEVWHSHRVARRARIVVRTLSSDRFRMIAAHNGYCRIEGVGNHTREWLIEPNQVTILDKVGGKGEHEIELYFHIHPEWDMRNDSKAILLADGRWECRLHLCSILTWRVASDAYHPGFGVEEASRCVVGKGRVVLPIEITTMITLNGKAVSPVPREGPGGSVE